MTVFSNLHWHSPQKSFQGCKLSEKTLQTQAMITFMENSRFIFMQKRAKFRLTKNPIAVAFSKGFSFLWTTKDVNISQNS